jgi:demethylmenaquinone methyltransferase/2-methoxy-6-polyprenyl-1,4-benzoquinol methylase
MSGSATDHGLGEGAPAPASARKAHALELFRGLPARYDLLSALLSFGQDPRWRRALVAAVAPRPGEHVLDVATGTGLVAAELLRRGRCHVVGVDQSEEMLAAARARFAGDAGGALRRRTPASAGHIELLRAEAEALPFADESFDALTFTYLLRYVDDPRATLRELARVLRPGGRMGSLEFGVPAGPAARAAWRVYTSLALPGLGRAVSPAWGAVGHFLGASISEFYERHPLPRIVSYWREAGFEDVRVKPMSLGGGVLVVARKRRSGERSPERRDDARGA